MNIGRNDPCPCGSGKKFKKCHLGREEELVLDHLEHLPEDAAKMIAALPEVSYGRGREIVDGLDLEELTGSQVGLRLIDLKAYLDLPFVKREFKGDLNRVSAGQMINPIKTASADPDHIYIALSPAVSDSTLIHQLAHALDYLAGSKINPGRAKPLSMELEIPLELLEHPKEFGDWLAYLSNEFGVTLDAEDAIVDFLHEQGRLIPGSAFQDEDLTMIEAAGKRIMEFIRDNRRAIDERIRDRVGYMKTEAPKGEG